MKGLCDKIYLELTPPTEEDARSDQHRLMQALEAQGYCAVRLSLHSLRRLHEVCLKGDYRITASLVRTGNEWVLAALEAGDSSMRCHGLAVDYGSTTIVMELVDMVTGRVLARASMPNGQAAFGTDILTRITHVVGNKDGADALRLATAATFNALMEELGAAGGTDARNCPVMVVSGNTAMVHFLLGLDAWTVFASPYAPVTMNPGWMQGGELGLDFPGMVYFIPAASNYVGGDIVSGLLTMDFYKKDGVGAFFDIGTNGELVLGNREWLIAGAGAAGPALEGYISKYGVRAQDGAIDHISIDGNRLTYTTIGNQKPIGICGSGIIDLIARMRLSGWINIAGELNPAASPNIVEQDGEYAAVYAWEHESANGERLCFTQTDIRQYLETKAAARTMIDCLLDAAGCDEREIERFYLSGAFTAHSDLEMAITLGVFPDLPRERYVGIRNSSLDGARMLLLDRSRMEDVRELTERMYCVQFASMPDFIIRMYAAKFIPHTDMNRYPIIAERLREEGA